MECFGKVLKDSNDIISNCISTSLRMSKKEHFSGKPISSLKVMLKSVIVINMFAVVCVYKLFVTFFEEKKKKIFFFFQRASSFTK